ncbi:MAG: DUF268 domain-containing protein [Myxococcales bacterium]|nr:DUF268 domain-containing protein [Myxococcales bacterium]
MEQEGDAFSWGRLYPCLADRFAEGGLAKGHYFHQGLLVATRIFQAQPTRHVDVGSRIDGFVAHVASFREIEVVDIRPMSSHIHNIHYLQMDLMEPLGEEFLSCCDSLSCLHALEHFGLGRYGDPIRPKGYEIGLQNLIQMVKPGGTMYLSVPIGPQRIEFNAHRVFSVRFLWEHLKESFSLKHFSYVDDRGDLHEDQPFEDKDIDTNFGCHYGCGIWELQKKDAA